MVVFINYLTGTEMLVADDRREEYIKAGHKPAYISEPEPTQKQTEDKPVKKTRTRRTKK